MNYQPDPAFQKLFYAYTSHAGSIGMQLTALRDRADAADPLLVCTGSDLVLFPGSGRPPRVESFRRTTRGFIELAAVSHIPLAVGWLLRMRDVSHEDAVWRQSAQELIETIRTVATINTVALWRDAVAVEAWRGHEAAIADLVAYSCAVALPMLERIVRDDPELTFENLRQEYLEPPRSKSAPASMNEMMFATFALTFLDIGFRITRWLRDQALSWNRLMVLISGRSGRPTAGLSWETNNLCYLIQRASRDCFEADRLYIAPHAPAIDVATASDPSRSADLERQFRLLWFNLRAGVEMADKLFGEAASAQSVQGDPLARVAGVPGAGEPASAAALEPSKLMAQLRLVLEDPRQLLSNVAANYVIDQLAVNANDPSRVFIPGFSDVDYGAARSTALPVASNG